MKYRKPILVAEIGCNHMGSIEIALDLIKIAIINAKNRVIKLSTKNFFIINCQKL